VNKRQEEMILFDESNKNIIIGDSSTLPLSLEQLLDIDFLKENGYIKQVYDNGLTATVYKLFINNEFYNMKIKREHSLVKNVDGKTSFLNEVLRRQNMEKIRKDNILINQGVVKTLYCNYRKGILFSKWIEGSICNTYNREILRNLFALTWELEKNGMMEWDLCPGNILVDSNDSVYLFDFGYMFLHDPLTEFNSDGITNKLFHSVERFETRSFFPHLLKLDKKEAMELFRIEKEEAVYIFQKKIDYLTLHNANQELIQYATEVMNKWKRGLSSSIELTILYMTESFRSYILDIFDDISGKSCSKETIQKGQKVIEMIMNHYHMLKENDAFIFDDQFLSKEELISKYQKALADIHKYQL
jgi:hypothetical protein